MKISLYYSFNSVRFTDKKYQHQNIRRKTIYDVSQDILTRPGCNYVRLCSSLPGGIQLFDNCDKPCFIQCLIHVVPFVFRYICFLGITASHFQKEILINAETDTSFDLLHPYSYMTIMLLYRCTGLPVATIIYPTEKAEGIDLCFQVLSNYICYQYAENTRVENIIYPFTIYNKTINEIENT